MSHSTDEKNTVPLLASTGRWGSQPETLSDSRWNTPAPGEMDMALELVAIFICSHSGGGWTSYREAEPCSNPRNPTTPTATRPQVSRLIRWVAILPRISDRSWQSMCKPCRPKSQMKPSLPPLWERACPRTAATAAAINQPVPTPFAAKGRSHKNSPSSLQDSPTKSSPHPCRYPNSPPSAESPLCGSRPAREPLRQQRPAQLECHPLRGRGPLPQQGPLPQKTEHAAGRHRGRGRMSRPCGKLLSIRDF